MLDADSHEDDGPDDRIVIAQVNDAYWLLVGEDFLDAMLSGQAPFPTPVRCLHFRSGFDLSAFLPEGRPTTSLWCINPAIVERLRRKGELLVIDMPDGE